MIVACPLARFPRLGWAPWGWCEQDFACSAELLVAHASQVRHCEERGVGEPNVPFDSCTYSRSLMVMYLLPFSAPKLTLVEYCSCLYDKFGLISWFVRSTFYIVYVSQIDHIFILLVTRDHDWLAFTSSVLGSLHTKHWCVKQFDGLPFPCTCYMKLFPLRTAANGFFLLRSLFFMRHDVPACGTPFTRVIFFLAWWT